MCGSVEEVEGVLGSSVDEHSLRIVCSQTDMALMVKRF